MAMAAPNQPLPGLHVTAPDEDMEISDYERNADDIDIDIDLTVDPSHHEDENMDDDRSENDNRDDVMLDGDGNEDEDGMMQDNMSVPDEHLTDASDAAFADIEVKEAPQDEPVADQVDVEVQDSGQAEDYIDYDDTVEAQNQAEPEFPIQTDVEQPILDHSQFPSGEQGANQQQSVEAQNPEDLAGPQPVAQDQAPVAVEDHIQAQGVSVDHQVQESGDAHHNSEQPAEEPQNIEKIAESQPEHTSAQPVDDAGLAAVTEEEAQLLTEAPETSGQGGRSKNDSHQANVTATMEIPGQQEASEPAAQQSEEALDFSHLPFDPSHEAEDQSPHSGTSLHPVVVVYQGDEISLFPPDESDTSDSFYFLQDETLAHESIKNMLQACRQVLGETVREEDELEIDIVELGLCVTEDSEHATNTSFAQILDVYLQLHQLDGHQNPGPLYMTLNTKTRFSARLQSLLAAIADGRGMSQLSFVDDATEGEPYIDSEVAPEEKNPASQTGNHDQEGARDPIPAADLSGSSNADAEQKPEPSAVTENQSEGHDAPSDAQPSGLQQPTEASPAARESQAQSYVSPPPEEIKKQESTEEEKSVFGEEGDVPNHESVSRTDDVAPDDQRENDQIDYDVENLDDAKDDASYRSSTLQGDNTPAVLEESTPRLDNASGLPQDDSTTSIAGLPHGESFDAGAEGPSGTAYGESQEHEPTGEYVEEQTSTVHVSTTASAEHESEHASQQEFDNADEALEQELERELNNQGESFDLPYDYPEIPDEDDYTENFEGGEYGYEQEANSQETQNGEETNEGYIVVETEDALESVHVADSNLPGDHQNTTHGDGFDDAEAEQTANNDLDGAHSAAENDLQDSLDEQAQPKAHASDEDDLDTIDYDDEELSQHDEAAVQSPSSAKRGWEELGQDDDDQADEQAPKKVKSE